MDQKLDRSRMWLISSSYFSDSSSHNSLWFSWCLLMESLESSTKIVRCQNLPSILVYFQVIITIAHLPQLDYHSPHSPECNLVLQQIHIERNRSLIGLNKVSPFSDRGFDVIWLLLLTTAIEEICNQEQSIQDQQCNFTLQFEKTVHNVESHTKPYITYSSFLFWKDSNTRSPPLIW